MKDRNWITLDYLEMLCEKQQLVIGCKRGDDEVWISSLGPHPSTLTSQEVHGILRESSLFEIRRILQQDPDLVDAQSVTRPELEERIKKMMN